MKMYIPTKSFLLDVIWTLLVLLFVYAAVSKLLVFDRFVAQIGQSLLITRFANVIAVIVPAIEIIVSALLLIPKTRTAGLIGSFVLMFGFSLYIVAIMMFSPQLPCSCGGVLNSLGWTEHLIFNIVFTFLALWGILLNNKVSSLTFPEINHV